MKIESEFKQLSLQNQSEKEKTSKIFCEMTLPDCLKTKSSKYFKFFDIYQIQEKKFLMATTVGNIVKFDFVNLNCDRKSNLSFQVSVTPESKMFEEILTCCKFGVFGNP